MAQRGPWLARGGYRLACGLPAANRMSMLGPRLGPRPLKEYARPASAQKSS